MRSPHLRGGVPVPPGIDEDLLLAHMADDLRRRGAEVVFDGPARLVITRSTPGRMSVLAFVDGNGALWLGERAGGRALLYDFTTATSLVTCAVFAVVAAGMAWFALGEPVLALFALGLALPWLYGANYVTCRFRIPAYLERLCWSVPPGGPPTRGLPPGAGAEPPPLPRP